MSRHLCGKMSSETSRPPGHQVAHGRGRLHSRLGHSVGLGTYSMPKPSSWGEAYIHQLFQGSPSYAGYQMKTKVPSPGREPAYESESRLQLVQRRLLSGFMWGDTGPT